MTKNLNFKIGNKKFQNYKKTLVIAEIGTNHNNSFKTCKQLILIAKNSGCDAVKFQIFKADKLVRKTDAGYSLLKKHEIPLGPKRCATPFRAGCTNYQPESSFLDPGREGNRFSGQPPI